MSYKPFLQPVLRHFSLLCSYLPPPIPVFFTTTTPRTFIQLPPRGTYPYEVSGGEVLVIQPTPFNTKCFTYFNFIIAMRVVGTPFVSLENLYSIVFTVQMGDIKIPTPPSLTERVVKNDQAQIGNVGKPPSENPFLRVPQCYTGGRNS